MISRPVAAALSCRQCQSAIYRAVLSRPIAHTSIRSLTQRPTTQLPILTRRLYSELKSADPEAKASQTSAAKEDLEDAIEAAKDASAEGDVPWFLEVEPPRHAPSQHAVTLPTIPEDAPAFLEPMIKYIHEDMGLDDISLLDLRELDPPAALGPNLIMLFGTTRSERHLHVSSGRFVRWLKREHDVSARADGLIGPGELRTKLRRLRKKAKLMGTNTAIVPGGDNGISTGWVCVNFGYHNGSSAESESFDESGRFSGFGASPLGTTVVVQCMTETRRAELDLEGLWKGVMKKSMRDAKTVQGEKTVDKAELEALVATKVQLPASASAKVTSASSKAKLPTSGSEMQWQAMKQASQKQRYFSTTARRLAAARTPDQNPLLDTIDMRKSKEPKQAMDEPTQVILPNFDQVQEDVLNIQLLGTPFSQDILLNLIKHIFQSTASGDTANKRLSLTDQLLQTAEERGLEIYNNDMFITVIESIATSPAYGPELQRAQRNFEHLLISEGAELSIPEVSRLMAVYQYQNNWEKFWDTFRIPPRLKSNRPPFLYEQAYRALAEAGNQKACIEALRWVYPEMVSQNPPVLPIGKVYYYLKACLRLADPEVEKLLNDPQPTEKLRLVQRRRLANREFLKVLQEVERTHELMLADFKG